MIKDYCKVSISWKPKTNNGYGVTYGTAVACIVYFEPSIKLNRGQDMTSSSDAMFISYENKAFNIGDQISYDKLYTITSVSRLYKPRTAIYDHTECDLKEVQNG